MALDSTRITVEYPTNMGVVAAIMQALHERFPGIEIGPEREGENAMVFLIPHDTVRLDETVAEMETPEESPTEIHEIAWRIEDGIAVCWHDKQPWPCNAMREKIETPKLTNLDEPIGGKILNLTECGPPPGCGCSCHRWPGVKHIVACCDEPPLRSEDEQAVIEAMRRGFERDQADPNSEDFRRQFTEDLTDIRAGLPAPTFCHICGEPMTKDEAVTTGWRHEDTTLTDTHEAVLTRRAPKAGTPVYWDYRWWVIDAGAVLFPAEWLVGESASGHMTSETYRWEDACGASVATIMLYGETNGENV